MEVLCLRSFMSSHFANLLHSFPVVINKTSIKLAQRPTRAVPLLQLAAVRSGTTRSLPPDVKLVYWPGRLEEVLPTIADHPRPANKCHFVRGWKKHTLIILAVALLVYLRWCFLGHSFPLSHWREDVQLVRSCYETMSISIQERHSNDQCRRY